MDEEKESKAEEMPREERAWTECHSPRNVPGVMDEYISKSMKVYREHASKSLPSEGGIMMEVSGLKKQHSYAEGCTKEAIVFKQDENSLGEGGEGRGIMRAHSMEGDASGRVETITTVSKEKKGRNEEKQQSTGGETKFTWNLGIGLKVFRDIIANKINPSENDADGDDWEFWGKLVSRGQSYMEANKHKIRKKVYAGIPSSLRGIIWQAISMSSDSELEHVYKALLLIKSNYTHIIQRDTTRTFPDEKRFAQLGKSGQQSLFNVVNAYSVYDPEIGYCQGIAFVAGILLLLLSEEDAFCTLVKLMNDYHLRDLYSHTMSGLNLKIFQFDSLLQEHLPRIATHLDSVGIKSSMYVSQWYMTLFSYRFPLDVVFPIIDILFIDGIDSIVLFSLAILESSADALLTMDFERLLEFLKFDIICPFINSPMSLVSSYLALKHLFPRLAFFEKQHLKKVTPFQIDPGSSSDSNLLVELNLSKSALSSMKNDFSALNSQFMALSKYCDSLKSQLESANARADDATNKLALFIDSICLPPTDAASSLSPENDNNLYAERLIKKNIDIVTENLSLKQKFSRITSKAHALIDECLNENVDNTVNIGAPTK